MRILLVRFGSLGNALMSVPAVRALRREKPEAFIALLCDPRTYGFWKDCPFVDMILIYDQKGKNKAGPGYLRMIGRLRGLKFSHSVHFRRFIRSELIGFLSGAKIRIGFDPGEFSLLTKKIPYREDIPLVWQNLRLVQELGVKDNDTRLEYWDKEPSQRVKALIESAGEFIVVVHPFAKSEKERRWPGFAELSFQLQKNFRARVIIIGQGEEKEIFKREWTEKEGKFLTAFDLPIPELASLIKQAHLFIGSDSGPLHLAVALGTPAIGIYGPRKNLEVHLKKWQPQAQNFRAVLPVKYCSFCSHFPCSKEEMLKCFAQVSVEEVLSRVRELGWKEK